MKNPHENFARWIAKLNGVEKSDDRKVGLRLYDLEGDPGQALRNSLSYDLEGNQIRTEITREELQSLLDVIRKDEGLVEQIVTKFRSEALHYLSGADEPLSRAYPYLQDLYELFDQAVASSSHDLCVIMLDAINCHIFQSEATKADLEGLGIIELHRVEPKVMQYVRQ